MLDVMIGLGHGPSSFCYFKNTALVFCIQDRYVILRKYSECCPLWKSLACDKHR